MSSTFKKQLYRVLKVVLTIYAVLGIVLWHLQEKILFHPVPLPAAHTFRFKQPFNEWLIPINDESKLHLVRFTLSESVPRKGIVLYFHGNRQNIERYARYTHSFTQKGYEVWMIDYPGFGKTTGKRTEQRMYDDASLIYTIAKKNISADSIIIYGKSLGTGVASQLASKKTCRRLLLETPYYSIPSLAWFHFPLYPTAQMSRFHFPVYRYLPQVQAPVSIFHGTYDRIIPYHHAEKLKPLLQPKDEFITLPKGTHNDLSDFRRYQQKLDSLLAL